MTTLPTRMWLVLVAVAVSVPLVARADEPPQRTFGASVGLSGGLFMAAGPAGAGGVVDLSPLDVELEMPLTRELTLQLWVPLVQLLVANVDEHQSFMWTSFFLRWSPAGGRGAFLSPGLGFLYAAVDDAGAFGPELSLRLGYEASSDRRGFAVTVDLRPWVDVLFGTDGGSGAGFGTALEVGFHFYGT